MSHSLTKSAPVPEQLRGKIATIGGDQESSFEQAFATLAFQYIGDKAPRLLDYMVGFQLVERNEDNTRAVGVFGFQVGKQWIYVPVFFLNGDLKGHELMYLKSQDQFVPLKENWVNYVMAKRPHVLGENEPQNLNQLNVIQPDLRSLAIPPNQSKAASVQVPIPEGVAEWAIPILPWLYKTSRTNPYTREEDRAWLPRLMGENYAVCKMAMDVRRAYPDLAEAMDRFYGKEAIRQAILDLREKTAAVAKSAVLCDEQPVDPESVQFCTFSILGGLQPRKKTAQEKVAITVDMDDVITKHTPKLDEAEQERLLRDGHLIQDTRNGDEVSVAYNTQIEVSLTNPDATSIYDVLVKPGSFERCLVIAHPYSGDRRERFCTVVRLDPRNWSNIDRAYIYVKPVTDNERETFPTWLEDQSRAELKKTGKYVAVCPDGTGTVPFRVREKVGDNRYRVSFETYGASRPKWLPSILEPETPGWAEYEHYYGEYVEISMNPGTQLRITHGCLYIPEDAKIIEVKAPKPPKPGQSNDCCDAAPCYADGNGESENPPIEPGNIADVQLGLIQKLATLKLYSNGGEISIDRAPLTSTKQALFSLVRKYGFREKKARLMVGEAQRARARGTAAQFFVKYAQGYPLVQEAPTAPSMITNEPAQGTDPAYGGVAAQYPDVQSMPVTGMSSAETDPSVYDTRPDAMPDPMAIQQAQQAAQTGQKEVFDTSMINGLLRTVRQDSLVERYMGDLLKALDRLGRMLFLFYWHNDQFGDRYGKSDMPELEDTLRNTFESLGDLTLFLKEKDVAPLPGAEMGEPQVEEAAE